MSWAHAHLDIPKQTNQLSDDSKIKYFLRWGILVLVIFPFEFFFLFLRQHIVLALVVINVPLMLPAAEKQKNIEWNSYCSYSALFCAPFCFLCSF